MVSILEILENLVFIISRNQKPRETEDSLPTPGSGTDTDHISCLIFFLLMTLGYANYFVSLCAVVDHRSFDSLDFLRYRLTSICYLMSNIQSIRFWLYATLVTATTSSSRIYYMALVLDIIYQVRGF